MPFTPSQVGMSAEGFSKSPTAPLAFEANGVLSHSSASLNSCLNQKTGHPLQRSHKRSTGVISRYRHAPRLCKSRNHPKRLQKPDNTSLFRPRAHLIPHCLCRGVYPEKQIFNLPVIRNNSSSFDSLKPMAPGLFYSSP